MSPFLITDKTNMYDSLLKLTAIHNRNKGIQLNT